MDVTNHILYVGFKIGPAGTACRFLKGRCEGNTGTHHQRDIVQKLGLKRSCDLSAYSKGEQLKEKTSQGIQLFYIDRRIVPSFQTGNRGEYVLIRESDDTGGYIPCRFQQLIFKVVHNSFPPSTYPHKRQVVL